MMSAALKVTTFKKFLASYASIKASEQLQKNEDPSAEDRILTKMEMVKDIFFKRKSQEHLTFRNHG